MSNGDVKESEVEVDSAAAEKAAAEKAAAEKAAAEKAAAEKAAAEKAAAEKAAAEKAAAEKAAAEKAAAEKAAAEKAAAEKAAAEKAAAEKAAAEKAAAEKAAAEKAAAEKAAAEKAAAEKAAAEKAAAEKAAAEKAAAEKAAAEKAAAEKAAAEKAAAEKAAAEKAAAEKAAAEKAAAEKAAAEQPITEKTSLSSIIADTPSSISSKPLSTLDHLLATTPTMAIAQASEEVESEPEESPSERMLISGVLSCSVLRIEWKNDQPYFVVSVTRQRSPQDKECWESAISYSRLRALHEVLHHDYPSVPLPRLPSQPKKNRSDVSSVAQYLSAVLTLRNQDVIGAQFKNGSVTPEEALAQDVLQLVLRNYGIHNPLGQREGGIRVKLVLEDSGDAMSYLKEESRLALQNDCCADCGVRIGVKRICWFSTPL